MQIHSLTGWEYAKAIGIGIVAAVLLSIIAVTGMRTGMSPMPQPLGLAFAQTLLGPVPLPVGLAFHVVYVTFWTVVYVVLFRESLTFLNALGLGLFLWVLVLVIFFPIVGWGFLGLNEGPQLIVASLVPHLLFALFIWGLARLTFSDQPQVGQGRQPSS